MMLVTMAAAFEGRRQVLPVELRQFRQSLQPFYLDSISCIEEKDFRERQYDETKEID
jgi:hypothetical protein